MTRLLLIILLTWPAWANPWNETERELWSVWGDTPGARVIPQTMAVVEQFTDRAKRAPLQHLVDHLEENRGLKFRYFVPWHVKNREQLGVFFREQMDKYYPPSQARIDTEMLEHLGLVPKGFEIRSFLEELYTEQIAGAYDPIHRQFFVVDIRKSLTTQLLSGGQDPYEMLIYHELDHALGDQHFDLDKLQTQALKAQNTDRMMAASSLFEGDATLAMFDHQMRHSGQSLDEANLSLAEMADWMAAFPIPLPGMGSYTRAPLYFKKALIFPYYMGADMVVAGRRLGGWPMVNRMYDQLPQSTEQVLHPERYLYVNDPPVEIDLASLPEELEGWQALSREDTGGEFLVLIFLEQHRVPHRERAAEGWGGDRYKVYTQGEQSFFLWVLDWDSIPDAVEFWQAAQKGFGNAPGQWRSSRRKKRVVLAHALPAQLWPKVEALCYAAPARKSSGKVGIW